jgi:hypothetical protein
MAKGTRFIAALASLALLGLVSTAVALAATVITTTTCAARPAAT